MSEWILILLSTIEQSLVLTYLLERLFLFLFNYELKPNNFKETIIKVFYTTETCLLYTKTHCVS